MAMFTTKSLIFLSFIIVSLHAQRIPDPNEVLCAAATFPDVCPAVYEPVCVADPKDCVTTPCFQTETISSGCEACKTEGVQSYTPGKCQYTCDAGNLPPGALQDVVDPVCGSYTKDCQDASCRETFSSSTIACKNPDVVQFSLGACDNGEGEWNEECVLEEEDWNEECVLEEEDWNEECVLEEEDWNEDVLDSNEVLCAAATFPDVCPAVYEPVCVAAFKACFTTPCFQTETISSGCEACKTEGVQSYTPGKCQYTCDYGNLPPGPLQDVVDPVCGSYTKDCQDAFCRATFSSSTIACQNPYVVEFNLGPCDDLESPWNDEEPNL